MTATVAPGQALTLQATYAGDATTLTFSVANGGGSVVFGPVTSGISHIAVGSYLFTWAVPAQQDAGTYTAIWTATFGASPQVTTESFTVSPSSGRCWCALTDIPALTGQPQPSQASLTAAQSMLEALIHRVWRATDAETRDYYWLSRATAWQALYVEAHPELLTMMDVAAISQDGLSITFKGGTSGVPLHSPAALSFLGALFRGSNTTIRMNSAFQKSRAGRRRGGYGSGATDAPAVTWTRL